MPASLSLHKRVLPRALRELAAAILPAVVAVVVAAVDVLAVADVV